MRALISWGVYFFPSMSTDHEVSPIWRLTERMVRSGLVMAWRLATSPTSTSPALEKPTTEGVVRDPSALGMTVGSPASSTETTELVVPRSMPTALGMDVPPETKSVVENLSVTISTSLRYPIFQGRARFSARTAGTPTLWVSAGEQRAT